jgi:hypothetical protein
VTVSAGWVAEPVQVKGAGDGCRRPTEQNRTRGGDPILPLCASVRRYAACRARSGAGRHLTGLPPLVKYSPGGGRVVVTLERKADEAMLCVSDDGIGIPASDLGHTCEPFYRARNAERVAAGLGLGLAIARLIVEQYGGALEAESAEGCGTTFTLRLPLANSGAACTTENTRAD